jgi:predicted ribosomally synthesized peptide with SipW-like signal peptide
MEYGMLSVFRRTDARVVASVLVVVGLALTWSRDTLAVFTDSDAVGANTFTAGTISLTTSPTTALITYSTMQPGDVVTNSITVTNAGNSQLRYAISSSATNADSKALKDQLVLTVKTVDVTTPASPCNDFDGTQLYTGDLDSTAGKLVGDSTQGSQAGDRTLNSSANEILCFRASLPLASGNTFQTATTTATFTFDSEQTANNP